MDVVVDVVSVGHHDMNRASVGVVDEWCFDLQFAGVPTLLQCEEMPTFGALESPSTVDAYGFPYLEKVVLWGCHVDATVPLPPFERKRVG